MLALLHSGAMTNPVVQSWWHLKVDGVKQPSAERVPLDTERVMLVARGAAVRTSNGCQCREHMDKGNIANVQSWWPMWVDGA